MQQDQQYQQSPIATTAVCDCSSAASQVLAALEACDAYEEIADDFVAAAATDADGRQWVRLTVYSMWSG